VFADEARGMIDLIGKSKRNENDMDSPGESFLKLDGMYGGMVTDPIFSTRRDSSKI
ncbi:hypothetical protein HAX54_026055, partial [Datura stramonium]|nr:hypothetical protein [Datura stramonium]